MNWNRRPRLLSPMALALGLVFSGACEPWPGFQSERSTPPANALGTLLTSKCDTQAFYDMVDDFVVADEEVRGEEDAARQTYDQEMAARSAPRLDLLFDNPRRLAQSETHDCQRLIATSSTDGLTFGPWVALLAVSNLSAPPPPAGRVMAVIVNYSSGEAYPDLGIASGGIYCVFMRQSGGGWEDTQVFRPRSGTCRGADPSEADGPITRLTTTSRVIDGSPTPNDYPDAARWMWDEASSSQYIALRCATGFCQLAPSGLSLPRTPYERPDSVPGWFDRQRLAVFTRGSGLEVSGLLGTIKPGEGVQFDTPAQQESALKADSMVAAEIALEGDDPSARGSYATKWEIPLTSIESDPSRHRVWMQVQGTDWYGWTRGQAKRLLQPATNVKHSGLRTVRWRWVEEDEDGWLPCRGACCVWY